MNSFFEPFALALTQWWQLSLTMLLSAAALAVIYHFELCRPWPLPIILGAILSLMICEAYPHIWILGAFAPVVLWAILATFAYFLPELGSLFDDNGHNSLWNYFEEIDDDKSLSQSDADISYR